ncbi:unnamed protein product [Peniophora sp. CBMAI 1063]|nr:unnamed protein product [Peniophora sp. CBMAI 1063]
MSEPPAPSFRFTDLPAELVVSIILFAQTAWHKEQFSAQAPYAGVKRYEVPRPPSTSSAVPPCCRGVTWDFSRPTCIRSSGLPLRLPSPAHSASQVCRWLRGILLEENSAIWRLDNTLYPSIAKRSGETRSISNGRTALEYGTRSLVAVDVCTCILRSLRSFYCSLERVKLRLPWSGDGTLASELQQFVRDTRSHADSRLRHIDIEALDADPLHVEDGPRRRMVAIHMVGLLTCRESGGNIIFFSGVMTSLSVHQGPDVDVVFGTALSVALSACASTLEFLTIDIAAGFVAEIQGNLTFPRLRYFRLCTHPTFGAILLGWMVLPYSLDLHLEPVDSWRACFTEKHEGVYEVPFWPSRHAPVGYFNNNSKWPTNFARSLAQPHRTASIHSPAAPTYAFDAGDPAKALWWRSTLVMGLDVRIDPSTKSREPAAARFPELVSMTFAESVDELRPVLEDPVARDWERSGDLEGKTAARRSLTFRDGQFFERKRARDFNSQYPKALYDTLRYVLAAVPGPSTTGVHELVFAKDSWLPDRSLGYEHILERFRSLRALHFDSPALPADARFKQNMEGRFASEHLQALALSLNVPGTGGVYLCPVLEEIHLQVAFDRLRQWLAPYSWEETFNSPGHLASGAHKIRLSPRCV